MIVDPSEQSKQDVLDIAQYIAKDSPSSAIRFLDCVEETYNTLSEFPEIGHKPYFDFIEGLQVITVSSFVGYSAYYRLSNGVVRIDRVSHDARDLPALFKLMTQNPI